MNQLVQALALSLQPPARQKGRVQSGCPLGAMLVRVVESFFWFLIVRCPHLQLMYCLTRDVGLEVGGLKVAFVWYGSEEVISTQNEVLARTQSRAIQKTAVIRQPRAGWTAAGFHLQSASKIQEESGTGCSLARFLPRRTLYLRGARHGSGRLRGDGSFHLGTSPVFGWCASRVF